jgi:tRNA threonylcarbamoyladenosine biosynthesis protein TsaE
MDFRVTSEHELPHVAEQIIRTQGEGKVILFFGEMGVGKTTLIKQLCKKLGVLEATTSPTFSIVNEYLGSENKPIYHFDFYRIEGEENKPIYHFDFYRIEGEEEVLDLGYEDYFYSGAYCFIEWPEKIPSLLPEDYTKITIQLDADNNRLISVAS